jgi:hypothetical protein
VPEVVYKERCREDQGGCEEGAAAQAGQEKGHCGRRLVIADWRAMLVLEVGGELAFDGRVP